MYWFQYQLNRLLDNLTFNFSFWLVTFGFQNLIRRNVFNWIFVWMISGSENIIPKSPIKSEVAVSIMVMLNMVIEIQRSWIMSTLSIDWGQKSQNADEERVHWVEKGDSEMTHWSLEDGFERMDGVLWESTWLVERLGYDKSTWWYLWILSMKKSMWRKAWVE